MKDDRDHAALPEPSAAESAADARISAITATTSAAAAVKSAAAAEESAAAAKNLPAGVDLSNVVTATVGGMTSLLALFVGVGLTADRMAVIFNGGTARSRIVAALLLAVVSIVLGLATVLLAKRFRYGWLVAFGALAALLASLIFGVYAASSSFSDGGRPTFTKVSLVSDGDAHAILSFTVTATGVKHDNLLRAFALWVPVITAPTTLPGDRSSGPSQTPISQSMPFYVATLRPDDKGVISQEVTVLLERPVTARYLRLQVYWDTLAGRQSPPSEADLTSAPTASATPSMEGVRPPTPVGALCGNQANAKVAAACVEILLVAALTPTPTPTPT